MFKCLDTGSRHITKSNLGIGKCLALTPKLLADGIQVTATQKGI